LGRCVATYNNSTSTTTYSVYDLGWNTLLDYTATSSTPRGGTAALAERYVHGADPDEILTITALPSNQVTYYHNDGVGNVTKLTNSSGAVVEQYTYDIFGTPTIENGSGTVISASQYANRFLFTGREYISGAGIYQYRNRVYSPGIGRFLQPDPIGHAGDGYNIYRYCGNDPVNSNDPSGLDGDDDDGAEFDFYEGGGSDFFSTGSSDSGTVTFSNYYGPTSGTASFSAGGRNTGNSFASVSINQVPQNFAANNVIQTGAGNSSFGVLDGVQATLTTAGVIPGLGEVTNAASAVISLFQGDWTGAGLSAAALIPFAGDFADVAKLARLGKKGAGAVKSVGQIGREGEALASEITGVGKNTEKFAVNGRNRIPDQVYAQNIVTRNPTALGEVKNVKYQAYTQQLKDDVTLVGPRGTVDVFLPPGARVSKPLQEAFDNPANPLNRIDLVAPQ
jgi:RHS repeat-associated protein